MEIILKEDIKGLGYKHDIIKVKPGYGRNFLIPQGKAIIANESNKKVMAENAKQASHKAAKMKENAQELAKKIGDITIDVKTKVGEKGKIFGSVTALQIQESLKSAIGIEIDRKSIDFNNKIKEAGTYDAILDLHKEVKHSIKFRVVSEEE